MTELCRVKDGYSLVPDSEFLASEAPKSWFSKQPEALEGLEQSADLEQLDSHVEQALASCDRYSTELDGKLAIELHKLLGIDRRVGSDFRFWAWMGLVKYPGIVAYRWEPKINCEELGKKIRSVERFSGGAVRQTFARLWWAVELTVSEDDGYQLSEELLALKGFQDAYEGIFGRAFCQYQPALKAFIQVVGSCQENTIRDAAREFGFAMSGRVLEVMSEDEIRDELLLILEDLGASKDHGVSQ